jgi:catalase
MTDRSTDGGLSERLVGALLADYPDHRPGTRPVHAFGIGAEGVFTPSDVAPTFSHAEQFHGPVPVTVRFSNGSGSGVEQDTAQDVHGLAAKFHLPSGATADLIAITLSQFFASTVDEFLGFAEAGVPVPVRPESWWGRLLDTLRLRPPAPPPTGPTSGSAGVMAYADRHRDLRGGLVAALELPVPASYGRVRYHGLHTWKLTNAEGVVRYGRLRWEPVAGERPLEVTDPPPDYLKAELGERLARGPIRFVLRLALAGQGDPLADPAVIWDTTRTRVVLGELALTRLVVDQEAGCERLSFNPTRVVPGLECSDDPILAARGGAYQWSCRERGGSGCPVGSWS